MMTNENQHVTAFFDTRPAADAAIARIVATGVPQTDIHIVEGRTEASTAAADDDKGFFEAIGDFFMGVEDRAAYAEGLNRGGYLVSVVTTAHNQDAILDILDDEGTVDMTEREAHWRAEGWTGEHSGHAAGTEGTIEVVQEEVRIGKREVDRGRVRVHSRVVETDVAEDVSLHSEEVNVTRKPVDRAATTGAGAFAATTLEATETAEEAVVSKEARVVEEIALEKTGKNRTETVEETVRHTEVDVEDERVG